MALPFHATSLKSTPTRKMLKISRCLPLEERLNILLVTVELSKRANDIPKQLAARHHIYDLIKAEEKDPYVVAQVSFFFGQGGRSPLQKKGKM